MVDYNIAAVTEPETACFSLKTTADVVNPIENILIWPKQPVQLSKRKIERLPSVVTSETWQQIRKGKRARKVINGGKKFMEETIGYREKVFK